MIKVFAFLACFVVIMIVGSIQVSKPVLHDEVVTTTEFGVVTYIDGCNVSKYNYTCWVRTDTGAEWRSTVSDYPGNMLNVGDRIYRQSVSNGQVVTRSLCRNDRCIQTSRCPWWAPCWGHGD